MKVRSYLYVLAVVSLLFAANHTYAQKQPPYTAVLSGTNIKAGSVLAVQDSVFYNPLLKPSIAKTNSIDNIISLHINEFSNHVLPDTFDVKVSVQLSYTDASNKNGTKQSTLEISYSKNFPYSHNASLFDNNYTIYQLKVLSINITGASANAVLPFIELQNTMVADRRFNVSCTAVSKIITDVSTVTTQGELSVSWASISLVPYYDLEWTYIDQSAIDAGNYSTKGNLDPALIFKNNASRVTITNTNYSIPLIYDGQGILFYRVRGVQYGDMGEMVPGAWSSDNNLAGLGQYSYGGHQRNLNWQATTSYAEEGKRKTVVQYFDGSLRMRQTVTKDNTTQTTVVAETLYDKQGRATIQVLPSPTLKNLIQYTPQFNVNLNSAEYDKDAYDRLDDPSDYCSKGADPMGTSSGASQYYSPQNPSLTKPSFNSFIPDAKTYPFTETRYTRDNTGRIDRQGGVGPAFQLGGGHETEYYYSAPEQDDIDALFGTEAGDASHYQKNMVQDANGQYSVSYIDMNGRTVATALAGDAPASLAPVDSYSTFNQTENLLSQTNNIIKDNSIKASKSILVPKAGNYTFHYSISPESFTQQDCKNATVCYDCLYDLTITINDNCSNSQFGGSPKTFTKSNFTLFNSGGSHSLDTTCKPADAIDFSFTQYLQGGSYDISKVLSISKEGMNYYRDSLYVPHNTCKSYNDFVLDQLQSLKTRLNCTSETAETYLPDAYRDQMLADVSPLSGQYADSSAGRSCYSIFDKVRVGLFGNIFFYRYQLVGGYQDENGNPDYVNHYDGQNWSLVPPQQLTKEEFIANFKSSWANTLLSLHPEYQLLLQYDRIKDAFIWESDFLKTTTYADALKKGYLNPTGSKTAPANQFLINKTDPIISYSFTTGAKQAIETSLFKYLKYSSFPLRYYSLWGTATSIVKCSGSDDNSCPALWNQSSNIFNENQLCTGDLDMAWRTFKAAYMQIRGDWIDGFTRQQSGITSFPQPPCQPVFPDRNALMQQYSGGSGSYGGYTGALTDTTTAKNNLNQYLYNNCKAYATRWWQQLAPCGYTQADSAVIVGYLIQVAYEGADIYHPFGSRTVKPSSTYRFRSFDDVINYYNKTVYNGTKNPLSCTAYLIDLPLPYDQPGVLVNKPIITAPDTCSCNRIQSLYNEYENSLSPVVPYISFSDYLYKTYHTKISQGLLDSLRSLCGYGYIDNTSSIKNTSTPLPQCRFLSNPVLLPTLLQCGTGSTCTNCTAVKKLNDQFSTDFPGLQINRDETSIDQQQKNTIYTNYMNLHLGFSKTAGDYLDFMDSCMAHSTTIIVPSCDTTKWQVYNTGSSIPINAATYMQASNNIPVPYSRFFGGGLFTAPDAILSSNYILVDKSENIVIKDQEIIVQWRVLPASVKDVINPFIEINGNTWTGATWAKDPYDPAWWFGTARISNLPTGGNVIQAMGLASNSHGLLGNWIKIYNTAGTLLYLGQFPNNCQDVATTKFPDDLALCGKEASDSAITLSMNPCDGMNDMAIKEATYYYDLYQQQLKNNFEQQYQSKCLNAVSLEHFTVSHQQTEYHFTLYYYDLAGNLIKTIAPAGVKQNRDPNWLAQVKIARANGTVQVPLHTMATTYRYNSLNQVVSQQSADGGVSQFWYDVLGRLVVSQNTKQKAEGTFSYTLFDALGRVVETGQKQQPTVMTDVISRDPVQLGKWLSYTYRIGNNVVVAEQVTSTVYDVRDPVSALLPKTGYVVNPLFQKDYTLRNRVSYTRYYDQLLWQGNKANYAGYDNSTTYSYDIHGSVDTLLHHYRTGVMSQHGYNQFKTVAYQYDLVSGKVNQVHYQPGMMDQFYHRYGYDGENRLTDVYTTDRKALIGVEEEHEAYYQYYKHGPLARTILGTRQVQGLDYAYTLQGWLKGVNSTEVNGAYDMGSDGGKNTLVAKDAYSYSLNYYPGDYSTISGLQPFPGFSAYLNGEYRPLYNGNISAMTVNVPKLGEAKLYNYQYDQLNRLVASDTWKGLNNNSWSGLQKQMDYRERLSYDGNGNVQTGLRNGSANQLDLENFSYSYDAVNKNRLLSIQNSVDGKKYNYSYDAIGEITHDELEGNTSLTWTVYGKIQSITKTDGSKITYVYDATGNRIGKQVAKGNQNSYEWYVKDGTGNTMAVYEQQAGSTKMLEREVNVYGSSLLGTEQRGLDVDALLSNQQNQRRGEKQYFLSNHLGNTLAVISDKKLAGTVVNGVITNYTADVVSATDYSSFGVELMDRQYNMGAIEYGFNGKWKEKESGYQNYGMRDYSARSRRFLSVDPLIKSYPYYSSYQFAGNKPITSIDLDGLEEKFKIITDFHIQYKPIIETPNLSTAVNNVAHNTLSFTWNNTGGAVMQSGKDVWNATIETTTGTYQPSRWEIDPVGAFSDWTHEVWNYFTKTPSKKILKDFRDAATDLNNYELPAQIVLAHKFSLPESPTITSRGIPTLEEIFSNNISTRGAAERYAEMTKYKGYFNANEFIGLNNPAFDLIDLNSSTIVDVTTTEAKSFNINKLTTKLDNLNSVKGGFQNRILQIYIRDGKYTSQQIKNLKQTLNNFIKDYKLKSSVQIDAIK